MKDQEIIEQLKKITEKIINRLISDSVVSVTKTADQVDIKIETQESGILIGYHGETLSALQLIISLIYYKETKVWQNLVIDVGNYQELRKEQINQQLVNIVNEVISTQTAMPVPYLSSSERKIAHLLLSDNPDVYTESEGQGYYRRLFVKPKAKVVE